MFCLFPSPANRLHQILLSDLLTAGEVSRSDLCVDLDTRVGRDKVVGNVIALADGNPTVHDGVVFPTW